MTLQVVSRTQKLMLRKKMNLKFLKGTKGDKENILVIGVYTHHDM
jgi:hypothetical protein